MRNLKSIIRGFLRKPTTSIINLVGLSLSLALVIILSAYCYSELTTDKHHNNGKNSFLFSLNVQGETQTGTVAILKNEIEQKISGVKNSIRISNPDNPPVFVIGDNKFKPELIFSDDGFFNIFSYKTKEGNLSTALEDPFGVVLTEDFAKKVFGSQSAIGEVIKIEDKHLFTVKAVIKKSTNKSFLNFDALANFEALKLLMPYRQLTGWNEGGYLNFVQLSPKTDTETVTNSIISLYPKKMLEMAREMNIELTPQLTPIENIYHSDLSFSGANFISKGDKQKSLTLLMVVILILIIAIFSFINISIFQWHVHLKQTGTMKVLGAGRFSIMKNMLIESLLMFLISFILSLLIVVIISPVIQKITGLQFRIDLIFSFSFLSLAIISNIAICLLINIIPIVRIAKSNAINNLQKTLSPQKQRSSLRAILVVGQFAIAIILIAFTLLVQKQIKFGGTNLSFNKNLNIAIPYNKQMWGRDNVIKDFLEIAPNISNYSFTQFYPGKNFNFDEFQIKQDGEIKDTRANRFCADAPFFDILDLEFSEGKAFTNSKADKNKVVVNESFVKKNNITNPVGLKLDMSEGEFEVVGVVKDFHFESVHKEIAPLVIRNLGYNTVCIVNLASNDFNTMHPTINDIKKFIAELSPNFPVEVKFLDQAVADMYKSEVQFRRTFTLFSLAAIVICMLGAFAMSLFACQKRIKEIGIRKVNGATIFEVIKLLNYKFVSQVFVALIIACPVAYYAMSKWLESFAYKTSISWWLFVIAGFSALIIVISTVTLQSLKVANRNPVEALRYE